MFNVFICCENPVDTQNNNIMLWEYCLWNFQPQTVFLHGIDKLPDNWPNMPWQTTIVTDLSLLSNENLVLVSPINATFQKGETPLNQFTHPESCTYIFGANNGQYNLPLTYSNKIYIETNQNTYQLFSWSAASIVLYDRKIRNGN